MLATMRKVFDKQAERVFERKKKKKEKKRKKRKKDSQLLWYEEEKAIVRNLNAVVVCLFETKSAGREKKIKKIHNRRGKMVTFKLIKHKKIVTEDYGGL